MLKFGFSTLETAKEVDGQIFSDIHQTLALGGLTSGVTNLELNAAYAAIANGGTYLEPKLYTKVVDNNGTVILDNTQTVSRQVIKETTAFLLTNAMQDTVIRGTGTAVNFSGMPIADKTGTTTDDLDVWFSGYTPYYTATTWTGYDNNNAKLSVDRAQLNLSKTLWKKVMEKIHENLPILDKSNSSSLCPNTTRGYIATFPSNSYASDNALPQIKFSSEFIYNLLIVMPPLNK